MHVLDGPDLFQLSQEGTARPMHTLKVAILDGRVAPAVVDDWVATTLASVPPLRWVLAGPRWARPVWVDQGCIDVGAHVDHVTLPAAGGEVELCDALSARCSGMLDRTRPLWRLTHLRGLAGRRDALVFQVHHAVADGMGSVALWRALADGGPAGAHAVMPGDEPEDVPEPPSLAGHAVRRGAGDLARLPGLLGRLGRSQRRLRADAKAGRATATKPFLGPPTRFNGEPEVARRCAFARLPLEQLRSVRQASGATLTEVFLTAGGGAVRRHLDALGEAPEQPLTTNVPVALPSRPHRYGNGTTVVSVSLCTDETDPTARLAGVRRSFQAARGSTNRDPRLLPDLQRFPRLYGGLVTGMEMDERRRRRPAYNLICSSVRGPDPFSLMGVPVAELRSVGPLAGHFGLNLTGWSYRDHLEVGIHAYASASERLHLLGDLLVDELDHLTAAVAS